MQDKNPIYVDLLLLFVAVVWGAQPAIMKLGMAYVTPMMFNVLRMIAAVVVSWAVFLMSRTHRKIERKNLHFLCISIFSFFIFQLLFAVGVNSTTSGNASLTQALLPASVVLINRLRKTESITYQTLLGVVVSVLGVLIIILASGKKIDFQMENLKGMLILLASQFAFGFFTVYTKDAVKQYSNYQIICYAITISSITFTLLSIRDLAVMDWSKLPAVAWGSILFSGILGMCIANFLWSWGVKKIGSTKTALYNNLPPIFAVITGYFLLHETFNLYQLLGAVTIFGGLYITRTQKLLIPFLGKEI